jgi:DNA-binding LacI/PurR family transcriptional regulator
VFARFRVTFANLRPLTPMIKRTVTSTDVAKRAGVSRTTVSMILNNSGTGTFPEETRARVLQAAAELGYSPNSAARMLVRGDTETIGLLVSNPTLLTVDAFVPQLLYGVSQTAQRFGYRVLLESITDPANPTAYLDLVGGKRIDGLIILNPRLKDDGLIRLIDQGFPAVLLGSVRHPQEFSVNFRNPPPVQALMAHLASLGHTRIAHVALSPPGPIGTNARLAAFRRALGELGLPYEDALVSYGAYSADSGYRAMLELLDRKVSATAVFAANDTLAMGAMAAIRERGLSIPGDMAVVGFDDLPFAAFTAPPLTTVRNDGMLQGRLAAEKLIHLLRHEEEPERRTYVDTQVVIRRSCGAAGA